MAIDRVAASMERGVGKCGLNEAAVRSSLWESLRVVRPNEPIDRGGGRGAILELLDRAQRRAPVTAPPQRKPACYFES